MVATAIDVTVMDKIRRVSTTTKPALNEAEGVTA
jgi:hypothetical protein